MALVGQRSRSHDTEVKFGGLTEASFSYYVEIRRPRVCIKCGYCSRTTLTVLLIIINTHGWMDGWMDGKLCNLMEAYIYVSF